MSTTTYQNNYISTSFPQRNIPIAPIPNRLKYYRRPLPIQINHPPSQPIPHERESSSKNSTYILPSLKRETSANSISLTDSNSKKNASTQTEKQTYTFCSPPREIDRLDRRISSAPGENSIQKSSRPNLKQRKLLSASNASKQSSHDDANNELSSVRSNHSLIQDERQRESFNDLIKQNQKPKIPSIVQKRRRIIFLYNATSPRNKQSISSISNNDQIEKRDSPIIPTTKSNTILPSKSSTVNPLKSSQSSDSAETDMVDSIQLAAILREITLEDNRLPSGASSKSQLTTTRADLSKYEYVVASPTNTATFRWSPSMIKADEELARKRFLQNCQHEMALSAHSQIPTLMASMVSDFNGTIGGNVADFEQSMQYKIKSPDSIAKQNSVSNAESVEPTADDDLIQLCFDATLKRFYDPNTGKYYEIM